MFRRRSFRSGTPAAVESPLANCKVQPLNVGRLAYRVETPSGRPFTLVRSALDSALLFAVDSQMWPTTLNGCRWFTDRGGQLCPSG